MAVKQTERTAWNAVNRSGIFAGETDTAVIDHHREALSVCTDIRNGYVSPTLGNVRQYALDQL